MNYSLPYISVEIAKLFNEELVFGRPTENRVLILTPKERNQTKSGLIIPGQVVEGVPKKGVIIQLGSITEEYESYKELLKVGRIVTYGMYAGKELELDQKLSESLEMILEKNTLTVLSMNEIIYVEANI